MISKSKLFDSFIAKSVFPDAVGPKRKTTFFWFNFLIIEFYRASSSVSPVLIRTTSSIGDMKILPSPIFPEAAASIIALFTDSTMSSDTAISNLILGRKSIVYSAPR